MRCSGWWVSAASACLFVVENSANDNNIQKSNNSDSSGDN